jgi:hypothetical protein
MTRDPAPEVWRLVVALGGGLMFVLSLVYFAVSYLWRFDTIAAPVRGLPGPVAFDLALFSVFALHHSIFARTPIKAWIERTIPPELQRSCYVWISSVLFLATCAWWQPVAGIVWQTGGPARVLLLTVQITGGILTLHSARRLDVLQLAGITQVVPRRAPLGLAARVTPLDDRGPYALVRHPIYLGWVLFVWAAPAMNGTRFVFAAISSLYLALAVPFEERDLRATHGAAYEAYERRVRWKMIPFIY